MAKTKNKQRFTRSALHHGDEADEVSLASSNMEDRDMITDEGEQAGDASLDLILRELREFRRDNGVQLSRIPGCQHGCDPGRPPAQV